VQFGTQMDAELPCIGTLRMQYCLHVNSYDIGTVRNSVVVPYAVALLGILLPGAGNRSDRPSQL
jgi:hypothetical protein